MMHFVNSFSTVIDKQFYGGSPTGIILPEQAAALTDDQMLRLSQNSGCDYNA